MSPFYRQFDAAQYDPKHYYRGLEAQREMTFDDDVDDDSYDEHCEFEARRPGLFVRTNRELF